MLKLKLQYFGHLMWRADSMEKTLRLGKIEGKRRRGQQRMRWLIASSTQWTWVGAKLQETVKTGKPGVLQSMEWQRAGHDSDWTRTTTVLSKGLVPTSPREHAPYFLQINFLFIIENLQIAGTMHMNHTPLPQFLISYISLVCAMLSLSVVSDSFWPHGL